LKKKRDKIAQKRPSLYTKNKPKTKKKRKKKKQQRKKKAKREKRGQRVRMRNLKRREDGIPGTGVT